MYMIAIIGTISDDNVAMLLTPPKIMIAVITANIIPVITGLT